MQKNAARQINAISILLFTSVRYYYLTNRHTDLIIKEKLKTKER